MEAQRWTLGRDVTMDSYTQYLQRVKQTSSGWADFLWQGAITFHTFNRRTGGHGGTSQIQVIQKLSQLWLTPLKISICCLEFCDPNIKVRVHLQMSETKVKSLHREICWSVNCVPFWEVVAINLHTETYAWRLVSWLLRWNKKGKKMVCVILKQQMVS